MSSTNYTRITTKSLQQMKSNGEKIAMLTAYDYSFAGLVDNSKIDVILVGDSASNVMAGHETTLPITLDQMIYHASSVIRAIYRALVVVDLPFGTYQGNSKEALKAVKRDNIKLEAYSELEKKFNQLQIPVYAEMILGLPEETYKSWTDGLGYLLDTSINNQIFVYQAEVYPNTEMNEPSYRKKHGIKTTKIELQEIHCSPREQTWLKEIQEIVTETSTMSTKDWQDKNLFSR